MADQVAIEVFGLPVAPLDAAAAFHRDHVPQLRELARAGDVVVILPPADHTHAAWRLATVQELAREAAPRRVNAVAGGDQADIESAIAYLQGAPGVTGQVLALAATSG